MGFTTNSKENIVIICFVANKMFNSNYFYNIKDISETKNQFLFQLKRKSVLNFY